MIFKGKDRQPLKSLYMAGLHKELGQDIEGHRRPLPAGRPQVFIDMFQFIGIGIIEQRTTISGGPYCRLGCQISSYQHIRTVRRAQP